MKRIIQYVVITLVLAGVLLPVIATFAPKAEASVTARRTAANMTADELATSWYYYRALSICVNEIDNNGWNWSLSSVENGDWFDNNWGIRPSLGGIYMRDTLQGVSYDGETTCVSNANELVKKALSFWGIDSVDFYCEIGARPRANGTNCKIGDGNFDKGASSISGTTRLARFQDALKGSVYQITVGNPNGNSTYPGPAPTMNGALAYAYHLKSFQLGCAYGKQPLTANPGGPRAMEVGIPDDNNQVQRRWYIMTVDANAYIPTFPNEPPIASMAPHYTSRTCEELATSTRVGSNYATAYQTAVTSNPDMAIQDPELNNTTANEDACPIDDKSALSWILCPLVELGDKTIARLRDSIARFMYTPNEQLFGNEGIQDGYAKFRNLGLGLIVIAGLFMIITQALGFEIFDAYMLRKVLPRLIIAAIGIAVSFQLLQFIVGIFNDLGLFAHKVIASLVPPNTAVEFQDFGATARDNVGAGVAAVGILALGLLWLGPFGLLSLIGTIVLALLLGIFVFAIREMIVMIAILMAPLGIAAYVLPGTQKIWSFWKNALITSLVMFPLIMAFIGAGEMLSNLLGGQGSDDYMKVLAVIVRYAPYFMLPFAFKMAGGLMTTIFSIANDRSRGAFDKLRKARENENAKRMDHYGGIAKGRVLQSRYKAYNAMKGKRGLGGIRRAVGGFNIESEMSAYNARYSKQMADQIATGPDDLIRAYSVDKASAKAGGMRAEAERDSSGWLQSVSGNYRENSDGRREYKTLGGRWVSEGAVDDSKNAFGANNHAAFQHSLTYEMQKALTQEEQDNLINNYSRVASGRFGMSDRQMGEVWTGSAFAKQNENRQWKHYRWSDGQASMNGLGLMREIDEKQGNYAMSQQNADTWSTMKQEAERAHATLQAGSGASDAERDQARETLQRAARIAYATRSAAMANVQDDNGAPVSAGGAGREVGAGAAGRVQEEMQRFVAVTEGLTRGTEYQYNPRDQINRVTTVGPSPRHVVPGGTPERRRPQ